MGMEGLVEEGKEIMQENMEEQVMDAGLIAAAQKVEHYEIASYGTARAWAQPDAGLWELRGSKALHSFFSRSDG